MKLTTEKLRAEMIEKIAVASGLRARDGRNEVAEAIYAEVGEPLLAANREAQPVAGELGEIRVGNLPTMNQEEYPGLGDWWVQLRIGANHGEILARVYGATPEEAMMRARLLTAPPAPAVPDEMSGDGPLTMHDCGYIEGWNACRAAMLAQPVSAGYKLVPVEPTAEMINAALASGASSIRTVYRVMLASAPEGGNG